MKLRILVHENGPALDPVRWPADIMERRKASSVGRVWRSLYQQDPTDIDGNLFKEVWWQVYEAMPDPVRTGIFIDSAYKTGVASDFSVAAVWSKAGDGIYLHDIKRARVEFPELVMMIERVYSKHKDLKPVVVVEDKSSGQALIPTMRKAKVPCVAWKHSLRGLRANAGKIARMEAVTPLVEQGKAWIPANAPWREEWLAEHRAVPSGAHDDQVDTTVMALDYFMGTQVPEVLADATLVDRDLERMRGSGARIVRGARDEEDAELERWRELGLL